MTEMSCEPEQCKGRIIFMSMYNDILWGNSQKEKECIANSTLVSLFAKRFSTGHWSFLGPGSETKWNATDKQKPGGEWDRVADCMLNTLRESGHPVFRGTSALSRGPLKSNGGKNIDTLQRGADDCRELLLRIIVSVNQLSVYGAVADWCQDLAQQINAHSPPSTETPVAHVDDDPVSQVSSESKQRCIEC